MHKSSHNIDSFEQIAEVYLFDFVVVFSSSKNFDPCKIVSTGINNVEKEKNTILWFAELSMLYSAPGSDVVATCQRYSSDWDH